ncbi:MAG TPA: ATP-binding protein [Anaeromyxobacteraceae bacterium]
MPDLFLPLFLVTAYVAVLFGAATWAERRKGLGPRLASSSVTYALSLAVYCTTWTYYGSVGFAARNGLLFLTVYLGPTLAVFSWPWLLRKLVRLKRDHGVTSLPDLVSLRYGKSQALGALATTVSFIGVIPYLALQMKTMVATAAIVSGQDRLRSYAENAGRLGPPIVLLMLAFTIVFGIRRISPTERHPGMMVAIAFESLVKLVAFIAAGLFVTYGMFHGFGDLVRRAMRPAASAALPDLLGGYGPTTWLTHLLLSASAIFFLPRQFHVAVVENPGERHIRTAMWLFPAYLLVINVFVVPIAFGGLLDGAPAASADTFVLSIPYAAGAHRLSWLVFLGGFSAGTGMVMVETMALATMISNHLLLPITDLWRPLQRVRRHLLVIRWCAAAFVIVAAFAYERTFGSAYELVSIGLTSFAAVVQLAPAVLGGLYWSRASKWGALAGMAAGFSTWAYTLVVPMFARAGWLAATLLTDGPWGLSLLRPEALLGLGGLDHLSHSVICSLLLNAGAVVFGSLLFPAQAEEEARAASIFGRSGTRPAVASRGREPLADAQEKRARVVALFAEFHDQRSSERLSERCFTAAGVSGGRLTALQLADVQANVEAALAASIGTAAAHVAVGRHELISEEEARTISHAYAQILAELRVSPAELRRRVNYHQEREILLAHEAAAQRFLAEMSTQLAASLDVDTTARAVVHLSVPRIADAAMLWLSPRASEEARSFVASSGTERARALSPPGGKITVPFCVNQALESGRPVVNACAAPGWWPVELGAVAAFAGDVTLPLLGRHGPLGTLSLFTTERSVLRLPQDLPLAEELAHLCALALDNANLFHSAEEAVRARDEFLAIASHELKTPLTPLQLKLQSLRRLATSGELAQYSPDRLLQVFGGAERQVKRLTGLINDLLDVSRITSGRLRLDLQLVDMGGVVRDALEAHRSETTAAGCDVVLDVSPGLVGHWDPIRLDQVFTNLLTNALKYAPGAPIEISAHGDDTTVRLILRDHGPGISAEDGERIFLPFERAVSYLSVSGFGLGLYIVRQIVQAHFGTVRLESAPGGGATFTVELPRQVGRAASA